MCLIHDFEQYIHNYAHSNSCAETTTDEYRSFSYPKFIKLMKFATCQYQVDGFGSIMMMSTTAMGGLMRLLTVSFTPSSGIAMPYLLIDIMSMKKKKACFVEYYDCTDQKLAYDSLLAIKDKYKNIPNYDEKPAWYIGERMKESLIKGGAVSAACPAQTLDKNLLSMAIDSFDAYMNLIALLKVDDNSDKTSIQTNLEGLRSFKSRMLNEGNPSDATMRKVLGEDGARKFFDEYVMPV